MCCMGVIFTGSVLPTPSSPSVLTFSLSGKVTEVIHNE